MKMVDREESVLEEEVNFNKMTAEENAGQIAVEKPEVDKVFIPIETILQLPELPNGCEITSLTTLLTFYGYEVTKTVMADKYLPK